MHDVDGNAGCGAVSSASHSIHSDGVVSARLQITDGSSGLRARYGELLRITVTSYVKIKPYNRFFIHTGCVSIYGLQLTWAAFFGCLRHCPST